MHSAGFGSLRPARLCSKNQSISRRSACPIGSTTIPFSITLLRSSRSTLPPLSINKAPTPNVPNASACSASSVARCAACSAFTHCSIIRRLYPIPQSTLHHPTGRRELNRHSRLARCDYERVLLSRALHLNSSRMRGSTVEVILWRTGREQVREFVRDSWRRFREFGAALFFFRDSGPPTANANCVYISIYFMVGAPRFELGTPSPPDWYSWPTGPDRLRQE